MTPALLTLRLSNDPLKPLPRGRRSFTQFRCPTGWKCSSASASSNSNSRSASPKQVCAKRFGGSESCWRNGRQTNILVPARQLYDQIIRPIEPALAAHRIDTLVVVPDEVFRIVPFAAFHDGSGFLVDRYATAIAPSLKLVEPKSLTSGPGTALVLGISQSVQGYVDLPNVQQEVGAVHAIEGGDVASLMKHSLGRGLRPTSRARATMSCTSPRTDNSAQTRAKPSCSRSTGPLTMDDLEADIKYGSCAKPRSNC